MVKDSLWILKHSPQSVAEVAGNDEARETVRRWALDWQRGKPQKPLLLYGPTGCGKTALARALAKEMDWVIVNGAEDANLERTVCGGSVCGLDGKTRLLLFDGVEAGFERSAAQSVLNAVKENAQPLVLSAEDAWAPKLQTLRGYCTLVQLRKINWRTVQKVLERICNAEEIGFEKPLLEEIARNSGGDLRAAITDLQVSLGSGAVGVWTSKRESRENVFESVRGILKAKRFRDAMDAGNASEADLDFLGKWVEENAALEFESPDEKARAFALLSRASEFEARVRKRQDYSLMKFVRCLTFGGMASVRRGSREGGGGRGFVRYGFPTAIKALGASRKSRELLRSGSAKIGARLHCSRRQALETFLVVGSKAGGWGIDEEEVALFNELLLNA